MINKWIKSLAFFFSIIDWGEILNGILLLFLGMAFSRYYGYRFEWNKYLDLVMWYFFLKASTSCISAVLSGDVYASLEINKNLRMNAADIRSIWVRSFWVLSILLAVMSFIPLTQIYLRGDFSRLSLLIISLVYLGEFVFLLEPVQKVAGSMLAFIYAFTSAFLLPALCFSFSQDYLKSSLILITFPIFLQLIAWKVAIDLEKSIEQKKVPVFSLVERIGTSNSLYIITSLLILASFTLFLDTSITGIWNKLILLLFGLASAWFSFKSIRIQIPNWDRALILIRLLLVMTVIFIIAALWVF
jgi:hypothetical protein